VRIALIGPAHPYKGGGARHTTELAHRLAAAGHDVIIESWKAQYPARLYPGQQTVDTPEGWPYPRTYRRLAWYRPDGWVAAGRRLRSADLVIFALLTPLQVPSYLSVLTGLTVGARTAKRPRTMVICHNVLPHERRPGDVALTRTLLARVDTVIVHSAEQAAEARDLAPTSPSSWPGSRRTSRRPRPLSPPPRLQINWPNGPCRPPTRNAGCCSSASSARTRASTSCCAPWPGHPRTSRSPWPGSSGAAPGKRST
jgi:hypothetical protein